MSEDTQKRLMEILVKGKQVTNSTWGCSKCNSDKNISILICNNCFLCYSPWLKKEIQDRLPIFINECMIFTNALKKVKSVNEELEITKETIENYLTAYELAKKVKIFLNFLSPDLTDYLNIHFPHK